MGKSWANSGCCDSVKVIDSLEVKNNSFVEIIDTLIKNEQNCNYFNKDLIFVIDVQTYANDTALVAISLTDVLSNNSINNAMGYFNYKGHLFLISLEKNHLIDLLFKKSKRKKSFKYNSRESAIEQLNINDDTLPTFTYLYFNGCLFFDAGYPPCPR